jgi:chemotaxis family two-component system response regulator PixG
MSLTNLSSELARIHNQQLSGELSISDGVQSLAYIYFYSGRLVHCASEHHRVRRLYRALQRHSQSSQPIVKDFFVGLDNNPLWDFYAVIKATQLGRLTKDGGKNVIQNLVQEVFYNLLSARRLEVSWAEKNYPTQTIVLLLPEQALDLAQKARAKWQEAGLGHVQNLISNFSLDMTAVITAPDRLQAMVTAEAIEKDYQQTLMMLLNGQNTIWDLSIMMRKSLVSVMRSLLPLVIDGIVEFREIPDLALPVKLPQRTVGVKSAAKGLVACIDDSPQIGKEMESILSQAGYETLFINDPLQGMSELLKRKPDLIFLDLIMPNTNGYEFCTFLRKTSQFKQVPIVILTGNDGVIDRVRAKIVGASDFLGKPPEVSKVLQIVEKYVTAPST